MSTFNFDGKIIHKESGAGIPDLLVELFDLESWADPEGREKPILLIDSPEGDRIAAAIRNNDIQALYKMAERIGSALTDDAGEFSFEVTPKDFNLPGKTEEKPDLILFVLAPDEPGLDISKRLLHFSRDIYFNAGSKEAYIIRLPTSLLKEREIPAGPQKEEGRETPASQLSVYVSDRIREQEFSAGAAAFHGAQAAVDVQQRKDFRTGFMKQVSSDFGVVPLTGVAESERRQD